MPPRILRFRLRLTRFDYTIHHVPGKELYTADTLSRAPTAQSKNDDAVLLEEIEACVGSVVESLPATEQRLDVYRHAQTQDSVSQQLKLYAIRDGPLKQLLVKNWLPISNTGTR